MSASERPAPLPTGTGPSENPAATTLLKSPRQSSGHLSLAAVSSCDRQNVTLSVEDATPDLIPFPLFWAKKLIDSASGPVPEYGSPEWSRLPDDDRRKVAACVRAAEEWRTRHHRPDFTGPMPSNWARRIQEARRPRPGDHPGGPVPWDRSKAAGQ